MKKRFLSLAIVIAIIAASGATAIWAFGAGSADDPLVSMSYINERLIPRITAYIDARLDGIADVEIGTSTAGNNRHFTVVPVPAGRRIMGEAGTEFILRMGRANIIATYRGGLADTTGGIDLAHGVEVPGNHLLIVPLSDGRGLSVTVDALIMVRGRYTVE